MKKPLVIIINGKGGVGKDTVCDIVKKHYCAGVFSSITPIKTIAKHYGWNGGKTEKDRKFLSDLKDAFTAYNDLPLDYMVRRLQESTNYCDDICLFHIREPEEIEKFKKYVLSKGYECKTLLIRSSRIKDEYGNHADDNVENYFYDCTYNNDGIIEALETDFMAFFEREVMG